MRRRNSLLLAGALCMGIALASCTADNAGAPTSMPPAGLRLAASATIKIGVYVTQANGSASGVILGYRSPNKSNEPPVCSIGGQGFDHSEIAVDAAGNVYAPNLRSENINVYAPNCGSLSATVADPYGADVDVAVGAGGTFYGVGGTHVSVCTSSSCDSELTDSSIKQLETAAVDRAGNVWASYYDQSGVPSLIVWLGGAMPGHVITGYANPNTPGDLEFDNAGKLVSLQTEFAKVYIYSCDAAEASCKHTRTAALKASALFGALNAKNTDFEATDYEADSIDVYSYPAFKYEYSYSSGLKPSYSVQGIAQVP
jgi:hypothetical protein